MKNWTQVPAGELNAANQRLWVAIGDNAEEVTTRINTDPAFVTNIARLMVNGGYEPSTSQKASREIMGTNFFGIEEAIKHFGVNPSKQQLAALAEVPFSEEVLTSHKDTHILVAVFSLSILDIRGIARKQSDRTLFYSQDWYDKQAFAKDKGEVGWQLVRKVPVANSTSKNWNEQQALLDKTEETPKAQVMVYTIIGHFLNTGERLFEKIYVRCSDLDSGGNRVYVGDFDAKGLYVISWSDDVRTNVLGLSAARKQ
ncbi:MAG TPA: hypothetical protein VMR73_02500 [Candidatus Paceibacterota bacterium]|nr:hypothetical protein [Candidatus Paceibacterota bacterium]